MTGPDRLSDLIDPALRSLGVRGRVREEQLRAALAQVVGPALAPLCRAERLDRGALLVATANTALAHQLQLESPRLIAALNEALGVQAVRRLRFTAL
ncbi:MAG: DUF721 domain-containing protein [Candidatus Dormibacteraeota bacterium]|nr:DUF721 domain-containing protein [Candidatus Dormibacteraeota bacterium]MBV9526082.1 DUF721 domain-containing protein [Candidatus Dormibacteraeota bacterium]